MKVGLLFSLRRMHTDRRNSGLALYGLHSMCAVLPEGYENFQIENLSSKTIISFLTKSLAGTDFLLYKLIHRFYLSVTYFFAVKNRSSVCSPSGKIPPACPSVPHNCHLRSHFPDPVPKSDCSSLSCSAGAL